ncbi:Holliday junction branch migration protein RuvA [Gracilimonas mengyeensis]|uniref:Holliday junction branch migration complex subunit RuvA n=1 Tax=Gracilimonas mengyeensis TaxID=1302730 RepID=A0A521FAV1_9BACT|nr:Holliday junction branch migration protein RuvA [Gracilimonas mengyeensis]SMO93305.1 Holliday junction DNA helicase subunit RuvA [Gracilimonas mengyeensis]
MIAFLKGFIEEKREGVVILDVQGVGYRVEISSITQEQLKSAGSEVKLLTYHHITDSDQRLFGFFSTDEKALFEKLITVKGVGPKLGLTILSGLPADQLIGAITNSDDKTLSRVNGIGKKTAQRIIVELKDKMAEYAKSAGVQATGSQEAGVTGEAISALESLGFKKREAEQAVMQALKEVDGDDSSKVIKKALASLNK